uniref:Vesicle transport protein USE1 n=1 Tax=Elaeophora elaphi TaxID=1147741 RepID=A0A0R3S3L5_9BILA
MSNKVQFNDEIGFLEIWDRIRKRISSDQCEMEEFVTMLDNLTYYSELALKNCKPKSREVYDALCCILREEVMNKKKRFIEASKYADESTDVVDSGFGTLHSQSLSEYSSQLISPSCTDADQKVISYRSKRIRPRSQKVLLPNVTYDAAVINNAFDIKVRNVKQCANTYPYMVTAIMCCFACLIAFTPHRFFPWFFPLISFHSPPPL